MPVNPHGSPSGPADEDDFDRALRELTENKGEPPRFREPSAAERARAARERQAQGRKAARPWAGRSRAPRRGEPRQAPPQPAARGRARRRPSSTVIIVIIVGCLSVGLILIGWLTNRHRSSSGSPRPAATAGASTRASGAALSPVPASAGRSLAVPFPGRPAAGYADGRDVVVLPPARPAGTYSAAQVLAARRTVVSRRHGLRRPAGYLVVCTETSPGRPATLTRVVLPAARRAADALPAAGGTRS